MFGIHDFGIFLASCIILNLTPGPDTFCILGRSLAAGRGAGVACALGISTGSVVHTIAAALGLSAILATSAEAFLVVKLAGAAYLIYLGTRMLLGHGSTLSLPADALPGLAAIYRQGFFTNVLNPKVALFFLAFMPQFISMHSTARFAAFLSLGLCFIVTATIWDLCLAWFSATLGKWLLNDKFKNHLNHAIGGLFILLGIRLAAVK